MTTSLLLLSGAGLPAWAWDDVVGGLSAPATVAPRPTVENATVTDYARAALDAAPEGDLTLIAHSAGGVVASEVARLAPERIRGVLAVAAIIPKADASFASSLPFPNRVILPLILRLAGTRPPESALRNGLGAGVDEETVRRFIDDLEPEPRSYFLSRVASNAALAAVPRTTYVLTAGDKEIPPQLQRGYAARLRDPRIVEIAGGHYPMISNIPALRAAIKDFLAVPAQ
ncbi:alpha/beta hydrolase [Microbacterium sp. LWO13-1.2]|uniref:alpha/beta fold hydrolase n=1 Tax=Microbacterium sp. LWO13-1.2 TaxID=3135262 RepID=UPI003138E49C